MAITASAPTASVPGLSATQTMQIKTAAKDFEAVFISQMMSHMFEGITTDPMFGGGPGEDMFRGMLVQEYGKQIANGPGLGVGVSDQIMKTMIQLQQKG